MVKTWYIHLDSIIRATEVGSVGIALSDCACCPS
jgi:hypothetical protein